MQAKSKKWLWTILTTLALASVFSHLAAGDKNSSDNHVAVVNRSVITQEEFDREMHIVQRRLSNMGKSPTDSQLSAIKEQTLERLIDRELLYQECQKKGIKVDEAALDEKFRKQFPDEAKFRNILSRMNLTEAVLKFQFMRGMTIQKFIDKEFVQKVKVPDKKIKDYYDSHPEYFKQPEQVRASHILIKVNPNADESQKAEARNTLKKIQQRIKKGEDFSAIAKESSQCPSSAKGGDRGYFRRGQMVKPFEEAAFSLKPGEVSDIVETKFGYHLIKVMEKKPESTITYKDAKNKIKQHLKGKIVRDKVRLYIAKLKEKAKVERFLKKAHQ